MPKPNRLIDCLIRNNDNFLIIAAGTLLFPKTIVKKLLHANQNKENVLWNNKSACLTISFDCDYPKDVEAIPALLNILKKYTFKTSFACVGHWIEKYPNEHKAILNAGHEIVNHTYSHPDNEILNPGRNFKTISRQEKKEEIEKCHEICMQVLNYEPKGCRIPHFKNLFTEEIYDILKELGYIYSSSTYLMNTYSHGMPFKTSKGIIEFPLSTCPKHPFTVFDTWHSFNSGKLAYRLIHNTEKEYIKLFDQLIDIAIETNSYINIYIDPADIMRIKNFSLILEYIQNKHDELWVANYQELLNHID